MPKRPQQHRPKGWKPYQPKQHDDRRGTATSRGYGTAWRKFRTVWLMDNPLCAYCLKLGKVTPATVVDHIVPHRGDMALFWQAGNHQSLCKRCHDSTKRREENRQ